MIYLKDLGACITICITIKAKTMTRTGCAYFENDIFFFEGYYEYTKGSKGDGYLQPDDDDKIEKKVLFMVGYHDENGHKIKLDSPADVSFIVNDKVQQDWDDAIQEKELEIQILESWKK